MDQADEHTVGAAQTAPEPLLIVVGFDASEPAVRALDAATRLLRGRTGSLHVVYVSPPPRVAELSAEAASQMEAAYDDMAGKVSLETRERLRATEERWTFEHRHGGVAAQLMEAADHLTEQRGPGGYTVIVVGSSTHRIHHFVGSVPVALVRHAKVPLIVVP
jgi:nucleotide-binding universal stress UspA family protein